MASKIRRVDLHFEISPSGAPILVPQRVSQKPNATQSIVRTNGGNVLVEGDSFRCGHSPKIGPFQSPPPGGGGRGSLSDAGQSIVRIGGALVATMAGKNRSCTEGVSELPNTASVLNDHRIVVTIDGQAVLLG